MITPTPPIGCPKSDLMTPCLCLDLDLFDSNVRAIASTCREHGVAWRPHAKCHKSPILARWLVDAGAIGVTCATVREAEIMVDAGISDILIANLVAGPTKVARLKRLCEKASITVAIDNLQQAIPMSELLARGNHRLRVLVELEIGMNRVGVAPEDAVPLAKAISKLPGLEVAGVMAYEGHLLTIEDKIKKTSAIRDTLNMAVAVRDDLEAAGIDCPIVSCGGSGSYPITVTQPGVTELQAGGAIFMDAFYRQQCGISELQHALTVLATVGSLPTDDRIIIDAGRKAMNIEICTPQLVGHPGIEVDWLSAEHGILKRTPSAALLEIGQQVELVPGYADLTNVLHPHFLGMRGSQLEQVIPIVR